MIGTKTIKEMQDIFGDDSQEYDYLVDMTVDYLVELVDRHKNLSDNEIDKRLQRATVGLLVDNDYPTYVADHIIRHAKEIFASL